MQIILAFLIGVVSALVGRPLFLHVSWLLYVARGDRVMPWKSRERRRMMIRYERNGR